MDLPNPSDQIAAIAANMKALHDRLMQAGARGLYKAGSIIITDAQDNYVPVAAGILRASGFVNEPDISDDNATVTIGFGGAAEAYALAVHEHLSEHSPHSWRVAEERGHAVQFHMGGPKYLERPVLAHGSDVQACVADEMRSVFSGG